MGTVESSFGFEEQGEPEQGGGTSSRTEASVATSAGKGPGRPVNTSDATKTSETKDSGGGIPKARRAAKKERVSIGIQVDRPVSEEEGVFTMPPDLSFDPASVPPQLNRKGELKQRQEGAETAQGESPEEEIARLKSRVKYLESRVRDWQNVARDFLFGLVLSPEMTSWYASLLREYLEEALLQIPQVEKVKFAECSFPSVPKEAPSVDLVSWEGMYSGEWNLSWSPKSWWIALSVLGRQSPLPTRFNAVVTISGVHIRGRLRTALPNDISSCRFAFCEKPVVDFKTSFQLLWGRLPVPVQLSIEAKVREGLEDLIRTRLLLPESYWLVLRRKRAMGVDKQDMLTAIQAAQRAREFVYSSIL